MHQLIAIGLALLTLPGWAQDIEPQPGLALTWQVGDARAVTVTPNFWLYVPEGKPPSPYVPGGRFTATYEGFVNIDLRGDYSFHASGKGGVKLEVNNAVLLDLKGIGGVAEAKTQSVRLNKGANPIKVTYTSPVKGDAQFRLFWSERPDNPVPHEPIRGGQLKHLPTAPLTQAGLVERGREVFLEHRCVRCHTSEGPGLPEFAMSGPDFNAIGSRTHRSWLAKWILNPKAQRPGARMPQLLHGDTAKDDAADIATYLSTLRNDPPKPAAEYPEPDLEAGGELVRELNCAGCHTLPGDLAEEGKLSLAHVNEKFKMGELTDFLRAPNAHYDWTRMPKFKYSDGEAWNIASWLRNTAKPHLEPKVELAVAAVERGKKLVITAGCINCHSHPGENEYKAPDLKVLEADQWTGGCLADKADDTSPHFGFSATDRAALRAFATTDRQSLHRYDPKEFALRQMRVLNCNECHGELEGFSDLTHVGLKLKPEWMTGLLDGSLKQRARPWLNHRMPAFPVRAKELAAGLAMAHGHAPVTPVEKGPVNAQLVETGRALLGVDGGFSCVACHGVKNRDPLQVFEAQGVNFSRVDERLHPEYFLRWMLDPLRVDPQTRMPDYFDDDARSVLVDVLEGDAKKQIEAIRQYLRQGQDMKIPVMQ